MSQPQSDYTIFGMKIMYGLVPGLVVLFGVWIFLIMHYRENALKKSSVGWRF